jgi:hypothetical protein
VLNNHLTTTDRWLAEASYKNSVKCGMATWKINYTRMSKLHEDITEMDSHRQTLTEEAVLSFLPRRRKAFLRTMELVQPSKKELEDGRSSVDEHDADMEKSLQHLSRVNLSMKPNRSSIMNRSRTFNSGIIDPLELPPLTEHNLFESHAVIAIQALEFEYKTVGFAIGLAVTTADKFLHIVGRVSSFKDVLNAASFHGDTKQAEIQLKAECNCSLPSHTFYLPECQGAIMDDNSSIKITPQSNHAQPTQDDVERITLRLFSPLETYKWWQCQLSPWVRS